MTAQPVTTKTIKEHIARAKAYVGKQDVLRSLHSLCEALGGLLKAQVFGREKFEIIILIEEVMRLLNQYPEVKEAAGGDLAYPKGQEKTLYLGLRRLLATIQETRARGKQEATRAQKMDLDELILAGQAHLTQKNYLEARKFFRRATERYPEERGVLVDVGQRLLKAGQFVEAVEYLERGLARDPSDSRPYAHLVTCFEALAEDEKAEDMLTTILKRFGGNESVFLRLAKLHLKKRKFTEAFDAADQALSRNPLSRDAVKILDTVGPKIYGASYKRKSQAAASTSGAADPAGDGATPAPVPGKVHKLDL